MKKFLTRFLAACAVLAVGSSVSFAAGGWGDNLDKALADAKAEKKLVLLDFTGSDWCGWCIKLHKEVFSKPEFEKYAKDNLVLVTVDFPQTKQLPRRVKEQNDKLQKQYAIKGYPTIIVLNSDGKQVGQLGYQEGGPGPFTAKLDELKGK
jgi:thioredoxin-related protein